MTDTLAQRLKEAATKAQWATRAVDWFDFHRLACPASILALLEEIERLKGQLEGCAIVAQDYQKGIEFLKPFGYGEQWKLVAVCRQSLDASISNTEAAERRTKQLDELTEKADSRMKEIERLKEQARREEMHRNATLEAERLDCQKTLIALAGVGMCTPEEGYGTNTSWAISDLCRAIKELEGKHGG